MKLAFFLLLLFSLSGMVLAQEYEYVECPFEIPEDEIEGDTLDCVEVTVPESRSGLSNNTIDLVLVILYANDEEEFAPIIFLAGGPGNSGTAFVEDFVDHPFRDQTSLILLDQRGTGYSTPSLDCTDNDEEEDIQDCYDSLIDSGVVLDAYRTEENAADVNDVITALELDSVNLYGLSYGTRLALTVMKDPHPAIEAVILDGVYPPNVLSYVEDPINIARVFEAVFEGCAADEDCNEKFPDLEDAFVAAVAGLNDENMVVTDSEDEEFEMSGDDLIDDLFSSFYDTDSIPYAPAVIYAALNRDGEAFSELLYEEDEEGFGENDGNSEGMFNSVDCADEVPFNTLEGVEQAIAALDLPAGWGEGLLEDAEDEMSVCEIWVVAPSDPSVREATVSDIPTLLMTGEYDPVTPPNWAELAAETLPNSFLFIIPAGGHGVVDMTDCTIGIAIDFLSKTTPDGSCVDEMPSPEWYLDYP